MGAVAPRSCSSESQRVRSSVCTVHQSLLQIPGLTGLGNWWCSNCSRISSPVVDSHEYNSLPFLTAGHCIGRVPGGATLSKRRAPGPDEALYKLIIGSLQRTEECTARLPECSSAVPPPVEWQLTGWGVLSDSSPNRGRGRWSRETTGQCFWSICLTRHT